MSFSRRAAACLFAGFLFSCTATQIHIHDRHALSFPPIEAFAKAHPGSTMVLLDYHHDVTFPQAGASSSNWAGALLDEGHVDHLFWVSGRSLPPAVRSSRMAWLERGIKSFPPAQAARIRTQVSLIDLDGLRQLVIRGPLIVSLDLDILDHDPGGLPGDFLDELIDWTITHRPQLLTIALSAAYQHDALGVWQRLERLIRALPDNGAEWYLEAGTESPIPEGGEENTAWRLWSSDPDEYARYGQGFWPGAGIWIGAPPGVRGELFRRGIKPGDWPAADVLSGWNDADRRALESGFPPERLDGLLREAASAMVSAWDGAPAWKPPASSTEPGVAIRLINGGSDRGFMARSRGDDTAAAVRFCARAAAEDPRHPPVLRSESAEISLELSVFGPWRGMKRPMDFRPGLDSLLLSKDGEVTLLQSSEALEHRYDREGFLEAIAKKAGLGQGSWSDPGITFMRAATIWSVRSLRASL